MVSRSQGPTPLVEGQVCPSFREATRTGLGQGGPPWGPCRSCSSQGGWNGQGRRHHERTQSSAARPSGSTIALHSKGPGTEVQGHKCQPAHANTLRGPGQQNKREHRPEPWSRRVLLRGLGQGIQLSAHSARKYRRLSLPGTAHSCCFALLYILISCPHLRRDLADRVVKRKGSVTTK